MLPFYLPLKSRGRKSMTSKRLLFLSLEVRERKRGSVELGGMTKVGNKI
jgi:hypothetical protein